MLIIYWCVCACGQHTHTHTHTPTHTHTHTVWLLKQTRASGRTLCTLGRPTPTPIPRPTPTYAPLQRDRLQQYRGKDAGTGSFSAEPRTRQQHRRQQELGKDTGGLEGASKTIDAPSGDVSPAGVPALSDAQSPTTSPHSSPAGFPATPSASTASSPCSPASAGTSGAVAHDASGSGCPVGMPPSRPVDLSLRVAPARITRIDSERADFIRGSVGLAQSVSKMRP
jgi:hypothetical protein